MRRRNIFVGAAALFLLLLLLIVHRSRRAGLAAANQEANKGHSRPVALAEELESQKWERMRALQETNVALRQLSTNNAAFQEWGKAFMLKVANDHLSKVPLFGLKAPLGPEDVTVVTYLTGVGAEFYLTTVDHRHSFIYLEGVLTKAVNWEAEMTGLFRDPTKLGRFGDNAGPWSKKEAELAAEAFVRAKGMNIQQMGGKLKPVVQPETFNLRMPDGSVKPVTAFYTVSWPDAKIEDCEVLEIRFRRTAAGNWEPTLWFEASTRVGDTESMDFIDLFQRFFADR